MKKRAFVRYTKQGKIVPGSLILTAGSYPNGPSLWKEVSADLCCDPAIVTTVTFSTQVETFEIANISITFYCNSTEIETIETVESSTDETSLVEVLNAEFSEYGTFEFVEDNTVILVIEQAKLTEICPEGNFSFVIYENPA